MMFWKKLWKKRHQNDGEEKHKTHSYSKHDNPIKSLNRRDGLTTSAPYGGMGVRELQLRLELLIEPVLSAHRSVFETAKELAGFTKVDQDLFLTSVERICRTDVELAFNFCQFAPRCLQLVDEEYWDDWITKLIEVYSDDGIDEATTAIQNADGYVRSISHAPASVTFENVSRILESFVIGLSGRRLNIDISDELYTDTVSIRLPNILEHFTSHEDNFTYYKSLAVHQWAQTWYGTWHINVDTLVKMYPNPARALSIFHKLETIRLDACVERDLPGIARAMKKISHDEYPEDLSNNWLRAIDELKNPATTVRDTMFFLETVYKDKLTPADKIYQGTLKPRETMQAIQNRKDQDKEKLQDRLAKLQRELEHSNSIEQEGFSIEDIQNVNMPNGMNTKLLFDNDDLHTREDIQQLLESILQDHGEIPDEYLIPSSSDPFEDNIEFDDDISESPDANTEEIHLYDEWDHSRQKYRKKWCHLRELEVRPKHDDFVNRTLFKHRSLLKHLHRTFEALREDDKRIKRQPYGDDIDLDAMIEAYADMKAGFEESQNLFTKSHKLDRNIAVMLMIDMSGSTAGWVNEMERESLILLCESLEILGDRYAIYGFSGISHKRCELYRVKEFNENYGKVVKARISGIEPQDYTRMGVAIRHLTTILNQVEAKTKLLITLSDGRPDDQDGYRGPYGIEDTRRALIEAKYLGIHPFCITIDQKAKDYLQHMYGAVNFAVIDKVDKLPYKVSDIYRRITV